MLTAILARPEVLGASTHIRETVYCPSHPPLAPHSGTLAGGYDGADCVHCGVGYNRSHWKRLSVYTRSILLE